MNEDPINDEYGRSMEGCGYSVIVAVMVIILIAILILS